MKHPATVSTLLVLGLFSLTCATFAQYFEYTPTEGGIHIFYISRAEIDGAPVEDGDEIGVFSSEGNEYTCFGAVVVDGEPPYILNAYQADQENPGFNAGDIIEFHIWDSSAESELIARSVPQIVRFEVDGFNIVILAAHTREVPDIELAGETGYEFGNVAINQHAEWRFIIYNMGEVPLNVESITSDNNAFTTDYDNDNPVQIAPNEYYMVTVIFSPTQEQEYNGRLTITSNDEDERLLYLNFSGVGVSQGAPDINLSDNVLNFGEVILGQYAERILTIQNQGDANLFIEGISDDFENEDVFTFAFNAQEGITIPPHNEYELVIRFTPVAVGEHTANLRIVSNSPNEESVVVNLIGVGVLGRHFDFTTTNAYHSLLVYAADIDGQSLVEGDEIGVFTPNGDCAGAAQVGEEQGDLFPVALSAWAAEGNIPGFLAGHPFAFRLWDVSAQNDYIAIVEYRTGYPYWVNGELTVIERLFAFTQPTPVIRVSTESLAFGSVAVGDASELPLTIYNVGTANLIISNISVQSDVFRVNFENELSIQPGAQAQVMVTFTPNSEGEFSDDLTIRCNDPNNQTVIVALSGVGVEERIPNIALSEYSHNFGVVPVGRYEDWTLVISNTGTGVLNVSQIFTQSEFFTVNLAQAMDIQPRETREVIVTFTPDEVREYSDVLTIISNDPESQRIEVNLLGVGGLPGPHFTYVETGENASLLINSATLDGELLVVGDEIGVFTPAGTCAGGVVLSANEEGNIYPIGITVWGDDPNAAGRQGFFANEPFAYRFYDLSAREEIAAFPNYLEGPQVFQVNGFTTLTLRAEHRPQPDIELLAYQLDFGAIIVGETATVPLFIRNIGTANLVVEDLSIEGDAVFNFTFEGNIVVAPGQTYELPVQFRPLETGEFSGTLLITSNDPDEQVVRANLLGVGLTPPPPDITVSDYSYNYGDILIGNTANWRLTITNDGYLPLVITGIQSNNQVFATDFSDHIEIPRG